MYSLVQDLLSFSHSTLPMHTPRLSSALALAILMIVLRLSHSAPWDLGRLSLAWHRHLNDVVRKERKKEKEGTHLEDFVRTRSPGLIES